MKYDDLEKTKELFEIDEDVPTPIENIEMEGISKDTVTDEFTLGLTDKEASIINKKTLIELFIILYLILEFTNIFLIKLFFIIPTITCSPNCFYILRFRRLIFNF